MSSFTREVGRWAQPECFIQTNPLFAQLSDDGNGDVITSDPPLKLLTFGIVLNIMLHISSELQTRTELVRLVKLSFVVFKAVTPMRVYFFLCTSI